MFTRKGSIGLIIFYGLLMVLCWQTPAVAASAPPPTIDDIVGTYSVKDAEVWYDFPDGFRGRWMYNLTWRITKISDTPPRVEVYIPEEDWDLRFTASYKNGFLVWSGGDVSDPTFSWASLGIALFSGKQGKVKFKADSGYAEYGTSVGDPYCEWDPHKGKMISTNPGLTVGATLASQGDEQAAFAPGEETVPLGAASPPTIDSLLGTYSCTLTSTLYSLTAGTTEKKPKQSDTVTITKIDDQTLNMSTSGGDMYIHYGAGVLMIVNVDADTLDTDAGYGILIAKGKPGKISLKGKLLQNRNLETPDDEFEVTKVSCKQTSE